MHEGLTAETEEVTFKPEELGEEVDGGDEGELPLLETLKIPSFVLGVAGGGAPRRPAGVPEYVLFRDGWKVVGFEIGAPAGLD